MKKILMNSRVMELLFLASIISILIMINGATVIYMPALADISKSLDISISKVANMTKLDFSGLALGCLFAGSLADSYGKRKVLLVALGLFVVASASATVSSNFYILMLSCFSMGLAKAAPSVLCIALILERYKEVEANKMMLIVRVFDLSSLVIIPMLSVWVLQQFSWRGNFTLIAALAIVSFILSILFIDSSYDKNKAPKFSLIDTFTKNITLIKNLEYMTNVIIYIIPPVLITLFMNSASVVMIKRGNITLDSYGAFGSVLVIVNILFCMLSIYITKKKGINYNKTLGAIVVLVGVVFMLMEPIKLTTYWGGHYRFEHWVIFIAVFIFAAGTAMMNGFMIRATQVFPKMSAVSLSLLFCLNNFLNARSIELSSYFYNNTMIPTVLIVGLGGFIMLFCLITLHIIEKKKALQKSTNT